MFSPPYEQQSHYKAMQYPTVSDASVAASPTSVVGALRRSASTLEPINEDVGEANSAFDVRSSNRPVMV